jgi:uncharacterized glyoxalase superfamily protein PhnB
MEIKGTVVELMVGSVAETARFYQDMLGFHLAHSDQENGKMYWAELHLGTFRLSIKEEHKHKLEAPFLQHYSIGGSVILCFQVEDIQAAYAKIEAKCQTLNHPHLTPCGAVDFSMKDINGYILTFEQTP